MDRKVLLILVVSFCTGCATVSESDCGKAEWAEIGKADAFAGHRGIEDSPMVRACEKHYFRVNQDEYKHGYEQGLESICQPSTALWLGKTGQPMNMACLESKYRDVVYYCNTGKAISIINVEIQRRKQLETVLREQTQFLVTDEAKLKEMDGILLRFVEKKSNLQEAIDLLSHPVDR